MHALQHALAQAAGHSTHALQHPFAHSARTSTHAAGHSTHALQHPVAHSAMPLTHAAGHPIQAPIQSLQSSHVQQQHFFWYAWQHCLQLLRVNLTRSFLGSHLRHVQKQHHAQQHSSTAPSPAPTYAPIAPGVVNGDGVGTAFNMK